MGKSIDPTDEAALEALPVGTWVVVTTVVGEHIEAERVPGGWCAPGDVVVASADIAEGGNKAIEVRA